MANVGVKLFHIVTHIYAASFSIKTSSCETNNIFQYNKKEKQKRDKTNA